MFGLCRTCMSKCEVKCNHHKKVKCSEECSVTGGQRAAGQQCLECKTANNELKNTCYQCHEFKSERCYHSDDERAITAKWETPELKKALELGYKILDIYEVKHFEKTSTDLFKS